MVLYHAENTDQKKRPEEERILPLQRHDFASHPCLAVCKGLTTVSSAPKLVWTGERLLGGSPWLSWAWGVRRHLTAAAATATAAGGGSNLGCRQPASCGSQPANLSSAIRSQPLDFNTAVHFDLCSREAAEPASQSEPQLLAGLKGAAALASAAGLPLLLRLLGRLA